ncbi:MAG: DNA-binding protein [Deltaproteobacteria bacterium]|nr:DNA-binding protein [Deltaproteobacteria bacterium]
MAAGNTTRMTLDMSPEMNELLNTLADSLHTSKAEVLRKAVLLLEVAAGAKKKGLKLGLAEKDQQLATEIVGI